ncbi:hypothetical protein GCK72_014243 [Caenorhabditis remanei]|uniref:Uncharacterized protein n=1 Tax=Caenorhabditis remanei TaxID=31234 RepID=A0A6A5GRH4_CAERE|nr:hypothetical protein GCK72_014243 [Caenorhabditis remanei]KAF1757787.1 hypothetical protein GCK72_014243 [Caenorhabditis remanei]
MIEVTTFQAKFFIHSPFKQSNRAIDSSNKFSIENTKSEWTSAAHQIMNTPQFRSLNFVNFEYNNSTELCVRLLWIDQTGSNNVIDLRIICELSRDATKNHICFTNIVRETT